MRLSEIRDILKAKVLAGDDQLDKVISAGGGADRMEDVLSAVTKEIVLLTGLTTEEVVRTARIAQVGALVFVRGKRIDEKVVALARSYGLPILRTRYSLFVASGRLYMNGLRGTEGYW